MPKEPKCKNCGGKHYKTFCYQNRKPIKQESFKSRDKRQVTKSLWFIKNRPDENGYYYCYLRIHSQCPNRLLESEVTLEHVKPKQRYPELKHDLNNLKASCSKCNELKSGISLEKLAESFPHLKKYLVDTT